MTHATPDAELAEAQLALGRAELADEGSEKLDPAARTDAQQLGEAPNVPGVFPEAARIERGELEPEDFAGDELAREEVHQGRGDGPASGGGAALAAPAVAVPEPRVRPGHRFINFLQGSWRELQRVQWPDRRQVLQATGVVIGFVIVAGVFLGVADTLAAKLMDFVLK
jgi:preprotein translocase SecE subunit